MSLRLRLIVAFVALAVVPLGAMTWYTYSSNVQALKDAAEHESDMLAGELSQRMQLITAQLGAGVERLMDMDGEMPAQATNSGPAVATGSAAPTITEVASPAVRSALVAPGPVATTTFEARVADGLGDAAMLLNNVELRGLFPIGRGGLSRGGSGRGLGGPSAGSRGDRPPPPRGSFTDARRGPSPPRFPSRPRPVGPVVAAAAITPAPATASGAPVAGPPAQATSPTAPATAGGVAAPAGSLPADRITIDLSAIRREMFREIAPDKSFEEMEPVERLRVIGEVNQRLLGIQQGLKIGAAELAKQAAEAKRESEALQAAAPALATPSPAVTAGDATAPSVQESRVTKKLALTGNRLTARREQNGVVRQINAEVNLPNLLSTVFSATPRDRGEVPFAVGKDGHIYAPTAADRKKVEALGTGVSGPDGTLGATRLPEWIVVTTADPTGSGLKFGIARPVGEALEDLKKTAARSAGLGLLFICATLIGIVPLSAGLTRNLSRLNAGVHRIASGDYGARVSVNSHDEIGRLAQAFNQMAGDVETHQRSAVGQERIKRELELGRQIQHDMLPHVPLRVGQTEVQGVSEAAGEVGGDFFNYFELKNGHVALLVGDVSGKGVGAALLMANLQASLRTRLALGQDLTALADALDRDIQDNTPGPVYSTLFVGTLDPSTRVLRYVNAGHNPQYVLRRRGGLERLESSGLPVGLLAGRGYTEGQTQLAPEDVVFCYTDGCVEAENESGEMFGADALERELLAAGPGTIDRADGADGLLRHMEGVFRTFRGSREPFDDVTMMVVKVG